MLNKYKRLIAFILALVMLVSVFSGCKKKETKKEDDTVKYTIKFNADGGEFTEGKSKYRVEEGKPFKSAVKTTPVVEKEGYQFVGWYNGDIEYDPENKTTIDLTYTAKWLKEYKISFDANGGSFVDEKRTEFVFTEGQIFEDVIKNTPEVEKTDYFFYEWYCEELDLVYDPSLKVEADAVFKAQWHDASVMSDQRLQGTWSGEVNLMKVLDANEIDDLPRGFKSSVKITGYFTFSDGKVTIYTLEDELKEIAPLYLEDLSEGLDDNDELLYDVVMLAYELDSRDAAKKYIKKNPPYIKSAWRKAVKLMIPDLDTDALIENIVDSDGRYVLVKNAEYTMDPETNTLTINGEELVIVPDEENVDVFKFTKASGSCAGYKDAELTRVK